MDKRKSFRPNLKALGFVIAAWGLASTACGFIPEVTAIEVLPPRTNALCSAPGAASGALGRGLYDINALSEYHGAYVGDLRISSYGDVVVDALSIALQLPGDDEPGEFSQIAVGDVFLQGSGDTARSAVIENVELLSRAQSETIKDKDYDISGIEYASAVIHIQAVRDGGLLLSDTATFTLDICEGCLLTPPDEDDCDEGVADALVCRPGQDVEHFQCVQPSSGSPF